MDWHLDNLDAKQILGSNLDQVGLSKFNHDIYCLVNLFGIKVCLGAKQLATKYENLKDPTGFC